MVFQLQNGETVCNEFHHPAVKTVIIQSLCCPLGKLSELLQISEIPSIDHLLAFAATMLLWVLTNLKIGCDLDFDMSYNLCCYNAAVEHIKTIWKEGGIQLQHLEVLTTNILSHIRKLPTHYQLPVDV